MLTLVPLLSTAALAALYVDSAGRYRATVVASAEDATGAMLRDVFDVVVRRTQVGASTVFSDVIREMGRIEFQGGRDPRPSELLEVGAGVLDSLVACDCALVVPAHGLYLFDPSSGTVWTSGTASSEWPARLAGRVIEPEGLRVRLQTASGTGPDGDWFSLLLPLTLESGGWWVFGIDVDLSRFGARVIEAAHDTISFSFMGTGLGATPGFGLRFEHPDGFVVYDESAGADVQYELPIWRDELSISAVRGSSPWTAVATLDWDHVDDVVPGGLPVSPLPLVSVTLASSALVTLLAAILLVRNSRLSRQREEFVAAVTHDLRTPLAQILLFAESLQLDGPTPKTNARAVAVIVREARRLDGLLTSALELIRSRRAPRSVEPIDLVPVIKEIQDAHRDLAGAKGVVLHGPSPGSPTVLVRAESALLRGALANLVENAVQYSEADQAVRIGLQVHDGSVTLFVEDEGPGLRSSEREEIWAAFQRGADARGDGVGLGLAIVADFARRHGGSVAVSEAPTGGSRFEMRLPTVSPADDDRT